MRLLSSSIAGISVALLGLLPLARAQAEPIADARESVDFDRDVRPILESHCFRCHGPGARVKAGLRLGSRAGLVDGGDSGPAVDLERPAASLFLRMIRWEDELHQMPPDGRLDPTDVATLTSWVEAGVPWGTPIPVAEAEAEAEDPAEPERRGRADGLEGWSYRPLVRPPVPAVRAADWPRNEIDRFVLARLEAAGLEPNPEADRLTLVRRATFDLTGLPPTPAEVRAFATDERPDAYERLVDRLLASPAYGERWGRRWLDVARYAETNGFERDTDKPWIWRWRDWVIEATNADLPFDRFCLEQLAGDELTDADAASHIATGYYRLMQWDDEPGQGALQARYDVLDDLANTTAQAFLGMTIGCARCHDHMGDPVPQRDYYRFVANFHGVTDMSLAGYVENVLSPADPEAWEAWRAAVAEREAGLAASRERLLATEREVRRWVVERALGGPAPPAVLDLSWRLYEGDWERLPDFDLEEPVARGTLGGVLDLGVARRSEHFGVVFEGALEVPADGAYDFMFAASGGARITVDGQVAARGNTGARGQVELAAGRTPIRVDVLHGSGSPELSVRWGPAAPLWLYTEEESGPDWQLPDFDDSGWSEGPPGFGTRATPGARVGTSWAGEALWLRRAFDWPGDPADLALAFHHDDDLEVWINGLPALSRGGYATAYETAAVPDAVRAALRPHGNVIAVHCRQVGGGQYVHVEPIDRQSAAVELPADLAFGLRSLTPVGLRRAIDGPDPLTLEHGAEALGPERLARYEADVATHAESRARELSGVLAATVQEQAEIPPLHVHVRGNAHVPGDPVEPGVPLALGGRALEPAPLGSGVPSSGRRRALAEWLVSDENPLLARVTANRIWLGHFGRGIVPTPNDFGELGERPSHPELLDWLACELRDGGWHQKRLHRLLMTSSAYRMSSAGRPAALEADGANRLWWRFARRRLDAEEVRDAILSVAGVLNPKMGGPSFFSRVPDDVLATSSRPHEVWGTSPEDERNRRSVYIRVKRSLQTPILASFDAADTDASCPVRFRTTQPTQALSLLNGEFARELAARFAERLAAEAGPDPAARVALALRLGLAREPRAAEVAAYVAWMEEAGRSFDLPPDEALRDFALLVFNLNEFLYVD